MQCRKNQMSRHSSANSNLCCFFISNFTNHDNAFGFRVGHKHINTINKVCTVHRVTTNPDTGTLAKT